jgi:hypothetical protein
VIPQECVLQDVLSVRGISADAERRRIDVLLIGFIERFGFDTHIESSFFSKGLSSIKRFRGGKGYNGVKNKGLRD